MSDKFKIKSSELTKIIESVTIDTLDKNSELLKNQLPSTIELSIKLSCIANIKMLEKIGLINIE